MDPSSSAFRHFGGVLVDAWRRWRALRVLLYVFVGIELAYVAATAAFLNLNLLPLAFASTNHVNATVRGGFSWLPGRVHLRGLRLTYQDHNLQFSIDVARATLDVHLIELLQHQFHASHLRGEGVRFHLRNRVDPWSQHEPQVGAFAPFPEFPGPAVFEAYVPPPPIPNDRYHLWTVHLDDVDVGVSEAWVQAFRYRGQGRAKGRFQLVPARRLWVGPASLELSPGLLTAGAYRVAVGLRGQIDCVVQPFDVLAPQGMAVFRYISAHVRFASPQLDPQVVGLFAGDSGLQVSSAHGSFLLDVTLKHGVLTPPSHLSIEQDELDLRTPSLELNAGHVRLGGELPGTTESAITLGVDRMLVRQATALGLPPFIAHAALRLVSDQRDVTQKFQVKYASLDEARLAVRDSHWFNRWLKQPGFELAGGGAAVLLRARYEHEQLAGRVLLETDGLGAKLGSKSIQFVGSVSARLRDVNLKALTGGLELAVNGRALRATFGHGEFNASGLHAHLRATRDARGERLRGQARVSAISSSTAELWLRATELALSMDSDMRADGPRLTHFSARTPRFSARGRSARFTSALVARGTLEQPAIGPGFGLKFEATALRPSLKLETAREPQLVEAGRVVMSGALRAMKSGALTGKVRLLPAAWRVETAGLRLQARAALSLRLRDLNLTSHAGHFEAGLTSSGVTLSDKTQRATCAHARAQSVELNAIGQLLPRGATTLRLNGEFRKSELSWGDFTTRADIGLAAHVAQYGPDNDARVRLAVSLRQAAIQSGTGDKTGWSALAKELDISAKFIREFGKFSGLARVRTESARGRIGSTALNTDLAANLSVDDLDPAAHTAHAKGEVQIRHASLPNAPEPVTGWWADVHLDSLFGHAAQTLELGGMFHAELRDATPGLAVLAAQGDLPKWIPSAFPLRGLSVTGSFGRRCRLTDIRLVNLSGGPARARGRLQSVPSGFEGALLLRLADFAPISAGVSFDSKHTHVGLFDGDAWLAKLNRGFDVKSSRAATAVCPTEPDECRAE